MGLIQHETAYYQGNPTALKPFTAQTAFTDPTYAECTQFNCARTWGLRVIDSTNVFTYGAGMYNFFENWNSACLDTESCQERMVDRENPPPPQKKLPLKVYETNVCEQCKTARMSTYGPSAPRDRASSFPTRHTPSCRKQAIRTHFVRRSYFSRRRPREVSKRLDSRRGDCT